LIGAILKGKKSGLEAKAAANELKKVLETKDVDNLLKTNAKNCYEHTGKVAESSICSLCDYESKYRYNDFKKELFLNKEDVSQFKDACLRHIDESLPIISKMLKNVFIIANLKDDFSGPKDKLRAEQSKHLDS